MSGAVTRRVAYLASAFPHLTETFVLREVDALERDGWEVAIFALKESPLPATHLEAQRWKSLVQRPALTSRALLGANLHYLLRAPGRVLGLWAQSLWWHRSSFNFLARVPVVLLRAAYVAREMQRRDVRHVHAHLATHPALGALAAARLAGTSFSVTAHAHDIFVNRAGLGEKLRRARFVACISDFNRHFLLGHYPDLDPARLALVRCGVIADPASAQRALRRQAATAGESEPSTVRIVCVASLQEYKGVAVLVEACARLRDRIGAFECLFVGAGALRAELETRVAALGLQDRVRFLGGQPMERVAELLDSALVFVAPSVIARDGQMDGIPVALMEALSKEVPVVASSLSGIPELVIHEQTGLLVPPGDADALAAAIERLTRNPELAARLARQGREHVRREFDLHENTARLERLFEAAILAARGQPHADPSTPPRPEQSPA